MKEELLSLLKQDALVKEKVKLSNGKVSSYYIDVRRVSLTPQGLYLISHLIWHLIENEDISAIGGPTLGADPIVSGACLFAYNHKKNLRGFIVRKNPKKHGRQKLIEGGELLPYEKVILVDDVATSGSSLIKAIEVLNKQKVKPIKAIVVVDRAEGAKENLAKLNCPLTSLFTKSDFFT